MRHNFCCHAISYYGRIAPFTITGADGNPTDYGWYMTRAYRYKSPYHDVMWKYFANQEHRPGCRAGELGVSFGVTAPTKP